MPAKAYMWLGAAVAALLALLAAGAAGYRMASNACKAKESASLRAALADVEAERVRANKADAALQEVLRQPKAGPRIREVLRGVTIPADCVVPGPVDDGLRDAIGRANAAAR